MKILISHCNEIPSCHCEELETHVPLHVEGEVVGPAEGALAQLALEGAVPRVLALVPRQLVRPREPPPAALIYVISNAISTSAYLISIIYYLYLPIAHIRLLAGVCSSMRLQV